MDEFAERAKKANIYIQQVTIPRESSFRANTIIIRTWNTQYDEMEIIPL